jgi:hypothetical protein
MGPHIAILVSDESTPALPGKIEPRLCHNFYFLSIFKSLYVQLLLILHLVDLLVVEYRSGNSAWVTDHL